MYQVADTALLPDHIPQMHAVVAMVTDDNAVLAQRADAYYSIINATLYQNGLTR